MAAQDDCRTPVAALRRAVKISIITVCLNSAATIRDTLESVTAQDHADREYIVVDGGSTDGTLDIVRAYGRGVDRLISGPDEGIYDAINKGIAAATGDVIGVLHADDVYESPGVLSAVMRAFSATPDADIVFGDLVFVRPDDLDRVVRHYSSKAFRPWRLRFGWMPPHPASFFRRSAYARLGPYATDLKISSDYEMFVKAFLIFQLKYARIDQILVRMRAGGLSTSGLRSSIRLNREIVTACRRNGIYTNLALVLLKTPFKLLELRTPATLR
jgi:glycosyltransferase involved in cell wall biosynthesis